MKKEKLEPEEHMKSTSYSPIKGLSSKEDMPSKKVSHMGKMKKKSIFAR